MKKIIKLFLLLNLFITPLFSQNSAVKLEKTTTFFPEQEEINQDNIDWYFLTVPENWEQLSGKKIKIAVAILKNTSKNKNSNPVIYLEGGPGGSAIEGIWSFLKHPLREKSDIVLVDVRGTGNSLPKFCPDLGKKILEILAKNQNAVEDEKQKTLAAMACKQDLISRDIDLNAYNSKSIAKDLNALKLALKYKNWNVYGASYGTYVAQVYANDFPNDIESLILDSSIADIGNYYNGNSENYVSSLNKVFTACENDPNCNKQYPNLEKVYYETIEKLTKNPITVGVDKKIIPSGNFTYNAEDFKVAIQQGLYNKKLIQVIPLLINQFNKGDKNTLSSLVAAFSGALSLDYGQYYCVSCNEAIPNNSLEKFNSTAQKFEKLKGGLSFYKSDFLVCDKWNFGTTNKKGLNDLSNLATLKSPVLVFSGAFDPITPAKNGIVIADRFENSYLINAPISGHVPSFSKMGSQVVNEFIQNPSKKPDAKEFETNNKVRFINEVEINGGVSNFGNSLNEFNLLFFAPLFIAVVVMLVAIFSFSFGFFKMQEARDKLLKVFIVFTSIVGLFIIIQLVLALNNTAQDNFYILAFGLPNQYGYLFTLQWLFIGLVFVSIFYFLMKIKSISDASIMATILFSLVLVGVYFQYWGFLF
ncbi:alpha/beta fold hydrolase [Flavobacterium columnare]|uniref:Proline iminopeptidase n=1 Tax=Flavobacterium columnare TaxID=996 RepID=A0A437UC69_9FLAO|nr:alpha/beta fold hydrolase [Flavobacterium columnare]RVU91203.1 alpha/beta fold hydrolase [Flavobacterium columnare]